MGRDLDTTVAALAEEIRQANAPEVEKVSDWLQDRPTPAEMSTRPGDIGTDMPEMMSGDDMAALEDASDAEFGDLWLEMLVEKHEGAVAMARAEEADGPFNAAVKLAKDIRMSQTAETDTIKRLLE